MPLPDRSTNPRYRHSLLDRLLGLPARDNAPGPRRRPRTRREERISRQVEDEARRSHREPGPLDWIVAAIKEDLRCLLSVSRPLAFEDVPPSDPIHRSPLTYGLTDLSDRTQAELAARDQLPGLVRDAITRFEPRLSDVEVALEVGQALDPVIRLRIRARLDIDPDPGRAIDLDTVMWLGPRKVDVNGGLDGGQATPALPA